MIIKEKIKNRIDEYLEFNSDILFIDNLVRIFGGAIRDSIAGDKINDIDILCGAKSFQILQDILIENGYTKVDMSSHDITSLYMEISIINMPVTFMKGLKIVQLIRPSVSQSNYSYEDGFFFVLKSVDISCCGVSYDGEHLYENCINAISHINNKFFKVNNYSQMYNPKRISHRIAKFESRDYKKIDNKATDVIRNIKIDKIFSDDKFIKEY